MEGARRFGASAVSRVKTLRALMRQPEWFFLVVYAVFGIAFMVAVPPMQVADETSHYYRAYQVSEGGLLPQVTKAGAGGYLPQGVIDFTNVSNFHNLSFHPEQRFYPRSQYPELAKFKSSTGDAPVRFANTAIYAPTSYVVPAAGIQVVKRVSSSVLVQFYAARLANFLFFGACLFFAIRMIPMGKWPLAIIGLLPMSINEAMSVAADSFIISMTALLVAFWFKLYVQKSISTKEWVLLGALAVLVALSKQSYFAFVPVLLILLLPVLKQHTERKARLIAVGAIGFAAAVATGVWALLSRPFSEDFAKWAVSTGIPINPDLHLHNLLTQPWSFVLLLWRNLTTQPGNEIVWSFFGNFGWLDTPIPLLLMILMAILLFLVFGIRDKLLPPALAFRWPATLFIAALAAFNILLVGAILYLYWTPVGSRHLAGYQGRYFIPVLIFLLPILINRYRHSISLRIIKIGWLVVLVWSLSTIVLRYYQIPYISPV